jgi:hypothetical protein
MPLVKLISVKNETEKAGDDKAVCGECGSGIEWVEDTDCLGEYNPYCSDHKIEFKESANHLDYKGS